MPWSEGVWDSEKSAHFASPWDGEYLFALGPGEDGYAVRVLRLGVAECRCYFPAGGRPDQGSDLGVDVDRREACAREDVVEMYSAIVGTAPCGYEATLPGAEGYCFYSGAMSPFVLLTAFRDEERAILAWNYGSVLEQHAGEWWEGGVAEY